MVDRFIARFGEEKIALLHSKLSVGERYDEWKRIEKGEAEIVIRSKIRNICSCTELRNNNNRRRT